MIPLFKRQRAASVLGLSLDGNRLEIVSLRRGGGTLHIRQSAVISLALSPLTDAPELVGQEIRNHLNQAGIREKRCVVCLPLSWVMSLQTKVPEMSEEDRASFLQLEAERGFHSGPESQITASSLFTAPSGEHYATLLAVPRNHLDPLQAVLRAAKLKPIAFALGVTALQPVAAEQGRVVFLALRNNTVDLQVTVGGGIAALRSLDSAIESQGAQKSVAADLIARELRITLGQLPGGLADVPGKLKILGQGEMTRQLVDDLTPRLAALGLKLETMDKASTANFDRALPAEIATSAALAVAANYLNGIDAAPDFLPPKAQPWKQLFRERLSPRKLAWAGGAAGFLVFCVAVAFAVQQWQIYKLQSEWDSISGTVAELNNDQDQIKKFRPWYDTTYRDLEILRKLKDAFHDASVTVKKVEIHDVSAVTCTGVARDDDAFARVHAKLANETNDISGLHAEKHGQKPLEFTINFQWGGAVANGN